MRKRKEMDEECKRLASQVEQNNAIWASGLQKARDQQTRLQEIVSRSPRIAKQNNEKNAVKSLTKTLEELKVNCSQYGVEESKLKKELESQTATPLRVFMVNFAKIALRTYEMQGKLSEARKTYRQLQTEETERRAKVGASEYDVFDVTFASQELLALNKASEHTVATEPPEASLHVIPEAAEEETVSGGTCESLHSTPPSQPPQASEQDVILARTNAVENYVTQQSEAVARKSVESDDNDSGEMTRDEDERESICAREPKQSLGIDIEVASVADEEYVPTADDNDMNGTVEEHDVSMQDQDVEPGDFSDDDSAINTGVDNAEENVTMEENDVEAREQTEANQATSSPVNSVLITSFENFGTPRTPTVKIPSQREELCGGQRSMCSSQQSQRDPIGNLGETPNRKGASSVVSSDTPNINNPSSSADPSQEANAFLSTILNAPPSPIQEGLPFNFDCHTDNDDFDPTAALNISATSNDPGADFLYLMESTNEKREKQRKSSEAPNGDFSFSVFGLGMDAAADAGCGGDFAFDFGSGSNGHEEGGDGEFHFSFGQNSDNNGSDDKTDKGFNLFNF
ncbi:hypothetical protein GCK32_006372 [Trichostrongylus colubriformis]|uniref:Uncharacterized protein n=1 Tax=Trichostrongylus colubriformis TaxID=6319 RepID=A0AAN8FL51_TRICO